jgi:tripartite-type tricarboxylate transporter receptor subunit TctC
MMPAAFAAPDGAAFWHNKQITIVVASTAGGGYDSYARLLGRHMGKYIPGAPTFNVVNMSGAGGNLAAGHLSNTLPKDGTAMALVLPGTVTGGLYTDKEKLHYDPSKLVFVGSANSEVDLCWARGDSGIKRLPDAFTHELVMGASAEGSASRQQPAALNALLGTKFRIVSGYPGTREILMAVEKGEVSGLCAMSLSGMEVQHRDWIESKFIVPISQNNPRGDPKVDAMGVPKATDFAKSDRDRAIMDLIWGQQTFGRPFVMAPGVPAERVATMRRAFLEALRDPALLAEAKKLKLDIGPVSGEELQKLVARLYASPPDIVRGAAAALAGRPPG